VSVLGVKNVAYAYAGTRAKALLRFLVAFLVNDYLTSVRSSNSGCRNIWNPPIKSKASPNQLRVTSIESRATVIIYIFSCKKQGFSIKKMLVDCFTFVRNDGQHFLYDRVVECRLFVFSFSEC